MSRFIVHSALVFALPLFVAGGCDLGEYNGNVVPDPPVEPPPNADRSTGCSIGCHGGQDSAAPPEDTVGNTDPTLASVGAHQAHLNVAPTWYAKLSCSDCHVVPVGINDPGHMDTPVPAELTFSAIASSDGVAATWANNSCTVYCHGASLPGATTPQLEWTAVGAIDSGKCDTCHGNPPPPPHPLGDNCGTCHATMQPGANTFLDPASHINGKVDFAADDNVQGCDSCHGENGESAPPLDTDGNSDPTSQTIGAHRTHIGASDWHRELYCSQCHLVPADVNAPGHMDDGDGQAEVNFDALNPQAAYNFATATCSNMYCHGNGYSQNAQETWTANLQLGCTGCHDDGTNNGVNMSGKHDTHLDENMRCGDCHYTVVNAQNGIKAPELHINGQHEISMAVGGTWNAATRQCTNIACHGNKSW